VFETLQQFLSSWNLKLMQLAPSFWLNSSVKLIRNLHDSVITYWLSFSRRLLDELFGHSEKYLIKSRAMDPSKKRA
jgi:hypothetical protein